MTQDPTPYDLLQDQAIGDLQDIVTPYYQPPGDVEYSFPVVGQGITADQYRLMSLGQANGIIHGNNGVVNDSPNSTGWRYYLDGHATDAETNQRNTLMLRAGTSAEAIVEGFYHRLTQDMELSFPSVTTATTYHVCLTYDPRREDEPTGPIHVEVYAGEPPTTHGRVHVLLHTVERQPNQLLTQATKTRHRPYTAGVVSVQNRNQLPDPAQYPAGTVVVPSADGNGIFVRRNGALEWVNPLAHLADAPGTWHNVRNIYSPYTQDSSTPLMARHVPGGVQLAGRLRSADGFSGSLSTGRELFQLPAGMNPTRSRIAFGWAANDSRAIRFSAKTNGYLEIGAPGISGNNLFIDFDLTISHH